MKRPLRLPSFLYKWLLLLLAVVPLLVSGQSDSTVHPPRSFDQQTLKKYAGQKEFIYEIDTPPQQMTLWQWIKYKIGEWLSKLLGKEGTYTITKIILYGLMVFAIVAIILNLAGIDIRRLIMRGPREAIVAQVSEENISEMNMDQLIFDAVSKQQWRLAVRYQYLKALRLLTDRELIHWRAGKTNMDYYHELKGDHLRSAFLIATDDFENVWYGNSEVTEQHYHQSKVTLAVFHNLIQKQLA